jgi:uncharacterized repeat protein (TIGR03803 family)
LISDRHGALFGATSFGGANGHGIAFKLTPAVNDYAETILWSFGSGLDGFQRGAGLLAGPNGVLYGTTTQGGEFGRGTVYELTPAKGGYAERVLWSFTNAADGSWPRASLIADKGGNLYGTTEAGGTYGDGTVFEVSP